jgi:hypothetical protein
MLEKQRTERKKQQTATTATQGSRTLEKAENREKKQQTATTRNLGS